MNKKSLLLLVVCCLNGLLVHLKAETITYDFSSTDYWVTESNGATHPGTGTSAQIKDIYYTVTNDCFVGNGEVYFDNGYLMLKYGASLKIPYNSDWIVNKVILHSHSGGSTSVKVNIYDSHDGIPISTSLIWGKDADHEYAISESKRQSPLYIKVSNKGNNARITSVTVDYTSAGSGDSDSGNEEGFVVSAPIFTPVSTSFSTESLDVTIEAAEGCEVYYTKDGSIPTYINAEEHNGTQGDVVKILASESPITLKAIAVDPATGKCSSVSSATYTYVEINNDGTKTKPYTVAEVKAKKSELYSSSVYVKGTIYGTMVNNDIRNITTSDFVPSNIVIGDKEIHIPVQLKDGTQIRDINLNDHPYLKGKELLVKGQMAEYGGSIGVIDPIAADYKITFDVPINSYGYATLYLDMSVSVPSGTTAYYCILEDNYAKLLPVGSIIPSEIGVIIESTPNTICTLTYTTMKNSNEEHISAENLLVGYTEEYPVGEDGYAYYALNVKNNKLGFYIPQTATDKANPAMGFTAKANKAYLRVPAEQKAEMFVIQRRSDEDAIVPVTYMRDDTIYDLLGRVVYFPTPGIYIRNGKKFVVK